MFEWFADTLRQYPEIAIFISLAFGYYFGSFTYKGLGIGAVTAQTWRIEAAAHSRISGVTVSDRAAIMVSLRACRMSEWSSPGSRSVTTDRRAAQS